MNNSENKILIKIKRWVLFFIVGLWLSGIKAFPIDTELKLFDAYFKDNLFLTNVFPKIHEFLSFVSSGVHQTNAQFPFLFYGTDWLAFAHILFGILYIGVYKNPIRNRWIVEFGIIACLLIFPLAFICGPIRGIPLIWRIIDCSFGFFGIIPLLIVRNYINVIEKEMPKTEFYPA